MLQILAAELVSSGSAATAANRVREPSPISAGCLPRRCEDPIQKSMAHSTTPCGVRALPLCKQKEAGWLLTDR